ncbi:POK25 protein, partial [Rhinoptilus africanus]|nr:POK25 protein [Rhinoptilus africanus]
PWKYLVWQILDKTIIPQPIRTAKTASAWNDLQKLLGIINWLHPLLGISTELLFPLF